MAPLAAQTLARGILFEKPTSVASEAKENPAGAGFPSILQRYPIKPYRHHTSVP